MAPRMLLWLFQLISIFSWSVGNDTTDVTPDLLYEGVECKNGTIKYCGYEYTEGPHCKDCLLSLWAKTGCKIDSEKGPAHCIESIEAWQMKTVRGVITNMNLYKDPQMAVVCHGPPETSSNVETSTNPATSDYLSVAVTGSAASVTYSSTLQSMFGEVTDGVSTRNPVGRATEWKIDGRVDRTTRLSVGGTPDKTTRSSVGDSPDQTTGSSVGNTPDRTTESAARDTPDRTTRLSVGDTPDTTTESPVGDTPDQTTRSSVGNTPDRTTESAAGDTPDRTTGLSVGDTPDTPVGDTPDTTTGLSVGDTPDTTTESPVGDTPYTKTESPVGDTPDTKTQSSAGDTPDTTTEAPVGDTPDTTIELSVGDIPDRTTRSSIGNTIDKTTASSIGHTPGKTTGSSTGYPDPRTTGLTTEDAAQAIGTHTFTTHTSVNSEQRKVTDKLITHTSTEGTLDYTPASNRKLNILDRTPSFASDVSINSRIHKPETSTVVGQSSESTVPVTPNDVALKTTASSSYVSVISSIRDKGSSEGPHLSVTSNILDNRSSEGSRLGMTSDIPVKGPSGGSHIPVKSEENLAKNGKTKTDQREEEAVGRGNVNDPSVHIGFPETAGQRQRTTSIKAILLICSLVFLVLVILALGIFLYRLWMRRRASSVYTFKHGAPLESKSNGRGPPPKLQVTWDDNESEAEKNEENCSECELIPIDQLDMVSETGCLRSSNYLTKHGLLSEDDII